MMKLLVARGADPRLKQKNGTTALMLAASGRPSGDDDAGPATDSLGGTAAIDLCLELGIDINAANTNGDTALHRAVANGALPVVRRLIEGGANVNATNARKQSPLDLVSPGAGDAKAAIARLLRQAGGAPR